MKPSPRYLRAAKRLIYRAIHARRAPHMVTARLAGVRVRFPSTNLVGETFYANAYGRVERAILDRLLVPGSVVIDVGANIGFYTCLFAKKVGPNGRVIAVEPTPSCFQLLQENVRLNGFEKIVDCRQCALSDCEGSAELHLFAEGGEGFNSLGVTKAIAGQHAVASIEVPTTTLDKLLSGRRIQPSCFIKVDVEGFEYHVLKGGIEHLRCLPNIWLMVELYEPAARECGSSIMDSIVLLEECGFKGYETTDDWRLAPLDKERFPHKPLRWGFFPDVFFFKQAPPPL